MTLSEYAEARADRCQKMAEEKDRAVHNVCQDNEETWEAVQEFDVVRSKFSISIASDQ